MTRLPYVEDLLGPDFDLAFFYEDLTLGVLHRPTGVKVRVPEHRILADPRPHGREALRARVTALVAEALRATVPGKLGEGACAIAGEAPRLSHGTSAPHDTPTRRSHR